MVEALRVHVNKGVLLTDCNSPLVIIRGSETTALARYRSSEPLELKQGESVYFLDHDALFKMGTSDARANIKSGGNCVELSGQTPTSMRYGGELLQASWGPVRLGESPRSEPMLDVKGDGKVIFTAVMMGHHRRDVVQPHFGQKLESVDFPGVVGIEIISASETFETSFVGVRENDRKIWKKFQTINYFDGDFKGRGFFYLMARESDDAILQIHLGLAMHTNTDDRIRLYEAQPQMFLNFTYNRESRYYLKQMDALARISLAFRGPEVVNGAYWERKRGLPAQMVDVLARFYQSQVFGGDDREKYLAEAKVFKSMTGLDVGEILRLDSYLVKDHLQALTKRLKQIRVKNP